MLNLMKKKVIVLSALSAMAALVAFDNEADAASASAKATITAGISVKKYMEVAKYANNINTVTAGDLIFGTIMPGAAGSGPSTVTVSPASAPVRSLSAGATASIVNSSSFGPAQFEVTGAAGAGYAVTVTEQETGITIINSDGATMTVTNFAVNPLSGTSLLGVDGKAVFKVGGELTVNAAQPTGDYAGTFTVTVAYN